MEQAWYRIWVSFTSAHYLSVCLQSLRTACTGQCQHKRPLSDKWNVEQDDPFLRNGDTIFFLLWTELKWFNEWKVILWQCALSCSFKNNAALDKNKTLCHVILKILIGLSTQYTRIYSFLKIFYHGAFQVPKKLKGRVSTVSFAGRKFNSKANLSLGNGLFQPLERPPLQSVAQHERPLYSTPALHCEILYCNLRSNM